VNNNASQPAARSTYTIVGDKPESLFECVAEIWRFRPLIAELVMRELKVRYKNRVGGILWSLFPPLMQVFTITLMVKFFLTPVSNYSAYLMGVMFLWQFFQNTVIDAGNSIVQNSLLARKIYFPRAILPVVSLLVNMLHFFISLALTLGYLFVLRTYPQQLRWEILLVFPIVFCVGVLGLGLGFLSARWNTMYEDFRFLSVTGMGLFFYLLPILYPIEKVAAHGKLYPYYMLNPLAAYLVAFQRALLPPPAAPPGTTVWPLVDVPWPFLVIAAVFSVVIFGIGYYTFERSKWIMMERL
jgi:ABC-type polysaccharide/polyol phosphate export permease